jgi:hypothetical protein
MLEITGGQSGWIFGVMNRPCRSLTLAFGEEDQLIDERKAP